MEELRDRLIFNRTQADKNSALQIRESKIKKFIALTNSDITVLERGAFTKNTINRINDFFTDLKTELLNAGYQFHIQDVVVGDTASYSGIFKKSDFETFLQNLNLLRQTIAVFPTTPATPTDNGYTIENLNSIEKILFDLHFLVEKMTENIYYSDEFFGGEI